MSNVRIPELTPAIGLDGSELLEIAVLVAPGQYVSRRTTAGLIAGAGPVTGVTPGTYGDSTHVSQFTVDATGRLTFAGNVPINTVGIGTVTSVSVATANGFSATITNPTTTPNITLQTSVNGILLGDGTGVSAASTTGSGAVVLANTPTLITPNIGTATGTGLQLSGLTASSAVATDASKNLVSVTNTGTGNNVLQTSPTLITPILGAASGTSLQLSSLTASSAVATDGSKNLVSVANTGSGNNVLATSPTLVTPILGAASATTINKITITQPASGATLTIQDGYTLTVNGNAIVNGNNTGDQTITLTGDVTGSGTGSFATTISNNAVTLAQMATVATARILGRATAGTGNVEALTGTQATALMVAMVGDSGSGGTKGLAPAPAAGDAAAGKFLKADGTYAVPSGSGSGTVVDVAVVTANGFAGTVADPTLHAAITITTTITGILQGNGTAISAASTTGSGAVVLATSPTLVTPALGTPSAIVLTNATGLPIAGITGLGTGVGTWLATPSSANLANAVTDETGSGALVFANTPTLVTPVLGVATATSINKVTITAPATSATLTLIDGATLTGPASSGTVMTLGNVETVTGAKTFNDGKLLLAGSSSGTTTLKASATASGTITLPAATDTLVGKATTDTLTNKTYDTAGTGNSFSINGTAITAVTGTGSVVLATSPTLAGTPLAPTAAVDTNTTQIATTAMVIAQAASATPLGDMPTAVVGTSTRYARADHIHPGREVLTGARTYYVGATIPTPTITIATPAVVSSTAHGLLTNDAVVFNVPQNTKTCTISAANPAVITLANSFAAGQPVKFLTSGSLPYGIVPGTTYYVISAGLSGSQFEISATVGGSAISTAAPTAGFTNSSANITITNANTYYSVGQRVRFATTGGLPTNFAVATDYYVVSASSTLITVSATNGGSAIVAGSAGTGTQTALQAGTQYASTTGALPTGITEGTIYYVISAGLTANAFEISATQGGAAINTSGSVTGTPIYNAYTGNDANTGLSATRAAAYLTIQKGLNTAAALDASTYAVTVQVSDGCHIDGATLPYILGSGGLTLQGNTTLPSNCLLSTTNADCIAQTGVGTWTVTGFKLQTTTGGFGIDHTGTGTLSIGQAEFGACAQAHINAQTSNATVVMNNDYLVSGGGQAHWIVQLGGTVFDSSRTISHIASITYSVATAYIQSYGDLQITSDTFAGYTVSGTRYSVGGLATINTNGAGTSYIPGTSAGSGTTPGTTPYGLYV